MLIIVLLIESDAVHYDRVQVTELSSSLSTDGYVLEPSCANPLNALATVVAVMTSRVRQPPPAYWSSSRTYSIRSERLFTAKLGTEGLQLQAGALFDQYRIVHHQIDDVSAFDA